MSVGIFRLISSADLGIWKGQIVQKFLWHGKNARMHWPDTSCETTTHQMHFLAQSSEVARSRNVGNSCKFVQILRGTWGLFLLHTQPQPLQIVKCQQVFKAKTLQHRNRFEEYHRFWNQQEDYALQARRSSPPVVGSKRVLLPHPGKGLRQQ